MNLLLVTQYFWPENFRINEVARSLTERGVRVNILTGKPNYPEGEIFPGYQASGCQTEQWHGATLHRVPLIPRGRQKPWKLALNYLSFVVSGLTAGTWMSRKVRCDVVFVYGLSPIFLAIPGILAAWLRRKPLVIWVQDLWPESLSATGHIRNRFVISVVRSIVRFIYRQADLLLVQSHAFEAQVRALAPNTPIAYYPNSVDDSFSKPSDTPRPSVQGLDSGFSVLFAGNIGAAQAVNVIIEAATLLKEFPDINFVVLGDGSSRQGMLDESKKRKLSNVHLPGRFPVATMPAFMQSASALLVTLADQAIFAATVPSKVQAYLAAGRPIIACLNGEGARLVEEARAGFATPAENAQALADTILRLYRLPPEERSALGENGRRYYRQHFDHEYLIDQLMNYLSAVCRKEKEFQ